MHAIAGVLYRCRAVLTRNLVDHLVCRLNRNGRLPFKVCYSPLPPCYVTSFAQRELRKPVHMEKPQISVTETAALSFQTKTWLGKMIRTLPSGLTNCHRNRR